MKNVGTRLLALVCALLVLAGAGFGMPAARAAEEAGISGTCGDGMTWTLAEDGTLTVRGEGVIDQTFRTPAGYWSEKTGLVRTVVIEPGVTGIGDYAFYGCAALTGVRIPDSVAEIGRSAFSDCASLTSVRLPDGLDRIADSLFFACAALEHVELPAGVRSIGDSAFMYCAALREAVIPEGVSSIGDSAFFGCAALERVSIPSSVRSIGDSAFHSCTSLTELVIPEGVVSIGSWAFGGCDSLTDVRLPAGVGYMGPNAFYDCPGLKSALLPGIERPLVPEKSECRTGVTWSFVHSADVMEANLFADGSELVRVESIGSRILVETYSAELELLSSRYLDSDLTARWGGAFVGEDANFIVLGWDNPEERDDREVVRVVKYDKDWNELDHASLWGANTFRPFRSGSLRCAEYGGMLYVHTCHLIYLLPDGLHHQANMSFCVRERDMEITDAQYLVSSQYGYAAHSFNQFILVDGERRLVTLDHGDAYPRAAVLNRYLEAAGGDRFVREDTWNNTEEVLVQPFPGAVGDNTTGASLGGLAETRTGYVAAYNYNGAGAASSGSVMGVATDDPEYVRNVFLSFTDKDDFTEAGTRVIGLTDYPAGGALSAGTPLLASVGPEGGYVLWEEQTVEINGDYAAYTPTGTLRWARYFADGSTGEIQSAAGALSDCQPAVLDGRVIWYVTGARRYVPMYRDYKASASMPVFYMLDENGLRVCAATPFADVDPDRYYALAVAWAYSLGVTTGRTETEFFPDGTVTRGQAVTFLWRAAGSPEPWQSGTDFTDLTQDYYKKAVLWAVEQGIARGTDETHFSPEDSCSYEHILTFLYRLAGEPDKTGEGAWYADAVRWAGTNGLTGASGYAPGDDCPRCDMVYFLWRQLG